MKAPVYFDYQATTPLDPGVVEAMRPFWEDHFGNPSSSQHEFGWKASAAVEKARSQVASVLSAEPDEIIFTSGATESNNLAILGLARTRIQPQDSHVIVSAVDHKSVLEPVHYLETLGYRVTILPVDRFGRVSVSQVADAITPQTFLVSLIYANNEIGTMNPVDPIGDLCHERGVYFHVDAVQAVGRTEVSVQKSKIDLLSLSAHKIYGPKGVGALYVRRKNPRVTLTPLVFGGGHEKGYRSGTLNVPGIVGLGAACEILAQRWVTDRHQSENLRRRLITGLQHHFPDLVVHGHPTDRISQNLSFAVPGILADLALSELRQFALSTGSACASESSSGESGSHVLRAIQTAHLRETMRLSLGRFSTEKQVDEFIDRFVSQLKHLKVKET